MTLLVISPDYASHLFPLATLATAWREAGERVVVATGHATEAIVGAFGYEWAHLRLGRGSNPGVIRAENQPPGEDEALRGFFAATRRGAVETLAFQAAARRSDLLWNPVGVARDVLDVVERVRPRHVMVDHLAFSARLGLMASGVRHADVVLGHPSTLVVGDEVYGYPTAWPRRFHPDPQALSHLRRQCEEVRDAFTAEWNAALGVLDPRRAPSRDAFAETGDLLLFNYPEELHPPARTVLMPPHVFLGSAVRTEPRDPELEEWLGSDSAPLVYVSLGSFLSVRADVLARIAEALRGLDVRVALARGQTPRAALEPVPGSWLVREALPQVTLLAHAALAVSHAGNNSVTEALHAGVPLVLLPFSTDQFAGAAALEDAGFGEALDPNVATGADLRDAVTRMLALGGEPRARLTALGKRLRMHPGSGVARRALVGS